MTQGHYILTPAHDLLCTRIHSSKESDTALSLFDEFTDAYEAYGFYTYADFYQFGQGLGIKDSRVEKIISEFATEKEMVATLIQQSFLKEEVKQQYLKLYLDKMGRLRLK